MLRKGTEGLAAFRTKELKRKIKEEKEKEKEREREMERNILWHKDSESQGIKQSLLNEFSEI